MGRVAVCTKKTTTLFFFQCFYIDAVVGRASRRKTKCFQTTVRHSSASKLDVEAPHPLPTHYMGLGLFQTMAGTEAVGSTFCWIS